MKRSLIWTIVIIVLACLGGAFFWARQQNTKNTNDSQYASYLNSGKKAAQEKKYDQAASDFKNAYQIKHTVQARAYQRQANNLSDANSDGIAGEYDDAIQAAVKAKDNDNGYSVMNEAARDLKHTLLDVKDNYENEIKPIFNQASDNEDKGNYSEAIDNYKEVLKLPYVNYKFYAAPKKKAQNGIDRDRSAQKQNDEDKQDDADKKAAKSDKHKAGAMGDHTVNGQTVTNSDIAALRKRVGQLGYEASSWSPQDLVDMFRQAASRGHNSPSEISKSDVESFLKP